MRAIILRGLGLHLICCVIYCAASPITIPRNLMLYTEAAVGTLGLELWDAVASGADTRRARSGSGKSLAGHGLWTKETCPPTGERLKRNRAVIEGLEKAWRLSHHGGNQAERREVGGWIYQTSRGKIDVYFQREEFWKHSELRGHGNPPLDLIPGTIVGVFHVHPNPTNEGWASGPSTNDVELANRHRVPGLVKGDKGVEVYGPPRGYWDKGDGNCFGAFKENDMKHGFTALGLGALILLQGCSVSGSSGGTARLLEMSLEKTPSSDISREEAIKVANKDMQMTGEDPSRHNNTACKLSSGWLIIYDEGSEYVIDKSDGAGATILGKRQIPQGNDVSAVRELNAASERDVRTERAGSIDKRAAINLTKSDAVRAYSSIDRFKITACELPDAWRIIYELEGDVSGGGPDYVVDKKTQKILYKKYNQ
jgi:hypothetical protein